MPIHPFACSCGKKWDALTLRVSQPIDPTCPACGKAGERDGFGVPLVKSDTAFFRGAEYGGGQFAGDPLVRDDYLKPAAEAGVSTNGKVYMHGLARYPGDPEAWVADTVEAKRVLERRGWGCESLGVKARQPDQEPTPVPVGEDMVDDELRKRVAAGRIDPGDAEKKRADVREEITPPWKRKHLKDRPVKRNPKKKARA